MRSYKENYEQCLVAPINTCLQTNQKKNLTIISKLISLHKDEKLNKREQ
jgi:hypothetical protein